MKGLKVFCVTLCALLLSVTSVAAEPPLLLTPIDNEVIFGREAVTVAGLVDPAETSVIVNGQAAELSQDPISGKTLFAATVPLQLGLQTISAQSSSGTSEVKVTRVEIQAKELDSGISAMYSGKAPRAALLSDYDRSGSDNLITLLAESSQLVFSRDQVGSALEPEHTISVLPDPLDFVEVDINGDDRLDYVVSHDISKAGSIAALSLVVQTEDGTFVSDVLPLELHNVHPIRVASGDLSGDGAPDLVVAFIGTSGNPSGIGVYFGDNNGGFSSGSFYSLETDHAPFAVEIVDVDNDTDKDVVVGVSTGDLTGHILTMINQTGSGDLGNPITSTAPMTPGVLVPLEINGDGLVDFVVSSVQSRNLLPMINQRDGSFFAGAGKSSPLPVVASLAAGEFDGNTGADLVAVGFSENPDEILPFNLAFIHGINGNDRPSVQSASSGGSSDLGAMLVRSGDFDGNGSDDVAVVDAETEEIRILKTIPSTTCESFPLHISQSRSEACFLLSATKPANARSAMVSVTVEDPDFTDEGEMCIGSSCIKLFGALASRRFDRKTETLSYLAPASWFADDITKVTFKHAKSLGYEVKGLEVTFSIADPSSASSFPIDISRKQRTQCFNLDIATLPQDTKSLLFSMSVHDGDFSNEGKLCAGSRCLELFGGFGVKANDRRTTLASLAMPRSWFSEGDN